MSGSIKTRARVAALALGVGVLGLLANAAPSFAVANKFPKVGANCQTDGKIDGAGSTLANTLQSLYITAYEQDVCGYPGAATSPDLNPGWTDPTLGTNGAPAGSGTMVAYNWTTQDGKKSDNGSGEGLEAMECRIDAFGGSDIPLTKEMLGSGAAPAAGTLQAAPTWAWGTVSAPFADSFQVNNQPPGNTWTTSNPPTCAVNSGTFPPFLPATSAAAAGDPYGTGYPNTSDAAEPMMQFPIGAGAVGVVVNMTGLGCTTLPNPITMTGAQLSDIMTGVAQFWDAEFPGWGCPANTPIKRVVRQDGSGTTYAFMTYLSHQNTGTLCDGTNTWSGLSVQSWGSVNDSVWPDQDGSKPGSCVTTTPVTRATGTGSVTGSGSMIATVGSTPGGIGYGELANWKGAQAVAVSGTLTNSSPTVTFSTAPPDVFNGETVTGSGLLAGTTVVSGAGTTTWTLSNNWTGASGTGTLTLQDTGLNYVSLPTPSNASVFAGPGTTASGPVTSNSIGAANCADAMSGFGAGSLPGGGSSAADAVGLGPALSDGTNGWVADPSTGTFAGDLTNTGDQWPVCTFTYDFVYTNFPQTQTGATGSTLVTSGPLQGITFDQERTLYSYFTYMLSPAGQAAGQTANGYQPIPTAWVSTLRSGFQQNF